MSDEKQSEQLNEEGNDIPLGIYDNFIGLYKNALDPDFCHGVMKSFDHYQRSNSVWCEDDQFQNSIAGRFDYAIELCNMSQNMNGLVDRDLNDVLMKCFNEYIHQYGHLKTSTFYSTTQKVQKTPAGGGYHVWHDENSALSQCSRAMVWMFYLNDNFGGGETEFLYYHKRVIPEQGTLLIWPAGLTHAHRGGLVLEGIKYVITGWFNVGGE